MLSSLIREWIYNRHQGAPCYKKKSNTQMVQNVDGNRCWAQHELFPGTAPRGPLWIDALDVPEGTD